MKTVEEILEELDGNTFDDLWDVNDESVLSNYKRIEKELDIDKHRWYFIGTDIYQIPVEGSSEDRYISATGICEMLGDGDSSDVGVNVEFEEVVRTPVTTYEYVRLLSHP